METVTSRDGTPIAFERSGAGPALVLVGGSLADHRFYTPLAEELSEGFTVYNFDRRGRGESGDTRPYAVEREVEDVGALVAHAEGPVFLYGHSAGLALALRAASGLDVARLVLAEPAMKPTPRTTDEYLATLHRDQRGVLEELRTTIGTAAPEVQESISSGVPAFEKRGKYLVSFGAARRHVALYVMRGSALKVPGMTSKRTTPPTR